MKQSPAFALALSVLALSAFSAQSQEFDIVISNGRVMDPETLYDGVANVGIKEGRIAKISKQPLSGTSEIDATGHVVAPGFIDTHFHWQAPLGYALGLRDGLTSSMDIEEGCAGTVIAKWYEMRKDVTQANYGCASSHEQARAMAIDGFDNEDVLVMGPAAALETRKDSGWSLGKADFDSGNEILRIIDKGLQDGALGIGSTVGYMRDGVTTREMFEVQKVGARYGRHTAVHTRFTPDDSVHENLGAQEIIANALALGAPATINHYNNPGWRLAHEIIQRLQEQGHNIWGEIYPYAAGSTALNAVFIQPENWVERLGHKFEDTLQDPITGNFYTEATYEEGVKSEPTKEILLWKMPAEDTIKWLTLKGATMASDAMFAEPLFGPWNTPFDELSNTHPRVAGARSISLRLGRENDIPLMQLLSILSYNAAKHLGDTGLKAMQERGRVQEGMIADIVVFDPATVTDNATYEQGTIPSTGFKAVIVNGTVTVQDDDLLEVFAGQPIRFEPESKPRFELVSEEAWNLKFSTGMPDVAPGIPPKGGN
ncbi:aminoacylase [Ruegeria atlantica]|uniref:aminoacylase n=1 Tax=Ruegeria atlantica TaxID=81569 RepID=UPI002493E4C8|nr:aminoacylase [Ruegeria atlantica]